MKRMTSQSHFKLLLLFSVLFLMGFTSHLSARTVMVTDADGNGGDPVVVTVSTPAAPTLDNQYVDVQFIVKNYNFQPITAVCRTKGSTDNAGNYRCWTHTERFPLDTWQDYSFGVPARTASGPGTKPIYIRYYPRLSEGDHQQEFIIDTLGQGSSNRFKIEAFGAYYLGLTYQYLEFNDSNAFYEVDWNNPYGPRTVTGEYLLENKCVPGMDPCFGPITILAVEATDPNFSVQLDATSIPFESYDYLYVTYQPNCRCTKLSYEDETHPNRVFIWYTASSQPGVFRRTQYMTGTNILNTASPCDCPQIGIDKVSK